MHDVKMLNLGCAVLCEAGDLNPSASSRFVQWASCSFHLWGLSFLICTMKGLNLKFEGPLSSESSS